MVAGHGGRARTVLDGRWPTFGGYGLAAVAIGAVGGWVWRVTGERPSYLVGTDGRAQITETGLTRIFAADATYSLIGIISGILLGILAIVMLRRVLQRHHRGWLIVPCALVAAAIAALVCWGVGVVGGTPLADRIAAASAGQSVPIDLELHAHMTLVVWPFAALVPLLMWSSFAADPDGRGGESDAAGTDAQESADRSVGPDAGNGGTGEADEVGRGHFELE